MGRSKFRSRNFFRSGKKKVSKRRIKQQVIEPQVASLPTPKGRQEILLFGVEIDDVDSVYVESYTHINNCDYDQYIVIQVIQMKELLSDVLCPNCKKPGIRFTRKPDDDLGFAARIVTECTNCMGVYQSGIFFTKDWRGKECTNHVFKHMGTALRNVVTVSKACSLP